MDPLPRVTFVSPCPLPPSKKQRRDEADDGTHVHADVDGAPPIPDLEAELIVRTATFVPLDNWRGEGSEWLINLCLAVGPGVSRAIRKTYLKENGDYYLKDILEAVNGLFTNDDSESWLDTEDSSDQARCQKRAKWWFEVNSGENWKGRVTTKKLDEFKHIFDTIDTDVIFNNPVMAIALGRIDILKFLVEERGIDSNGYFKVAGRQPILLLVAAICLHTPSFDYLCNVDGISASLPAFINEEDATCECVAAVSLSVSPTCLRKLLRHPSLRSDTASMSKTVAPFLRSIVSFETDTINEGDALSDGVYRNFTEKLAVLLEFGAQPRLAGVSCSPKYIMRRTKELFDKGQREYAFWERLVEMLQEA